MTRRKTWPIWVALVWKMLIADTSGSMCAMCVPSWRAGYTTNQYLLIRQLPKKWLLLRLVRLIVPYECSIFCIYILIHYTYDMMAWLKQQKKRECYVATVRCTYGRTAATIGYNMRQHTIELPRNVHKQAHILHFIAFAWNSRTCARHTVRSRQQCVQSDQSVHSRRPNGRKKAMVRKNVRHCSHLWSLCENMTAQPANS